MRLHFEKLGSGRPLLILHGLFGSNENWRTISNRLAADFEVWCLDLRNHGQSGHAPEMNLPVMAVDIAEMMRENRLSDPAVLGHSLGGKVAMQLAFDRPEMLGKLIVVDIAPRAYEPRHTRILDALGSLRPSDFQDRGAIENLLAPAVPEIAVRRFLLKNLRRDRQGSFQWRLNLDAITRNYDALNAAPSGEKPFKGPTLFVKGELSDYLVEDDLPLIKRHFPQAEVCVIKGADHWVHASAPDAFLECVANFLRK